MHKNLIRKMNESKKQYKEYLNEYLITNNISSEKKIELDEEIKKINVILSSLMKKNNIKFLIGFEIFTFKLFFL